jgi:hypothetical protein
MENNITDNKYILDNKFEAIKYRHEDQAKLLQYMTTLDNQLYAGFLTIQLAFGGFLTQFKIDDIISRTGLFIIDVVIALVSVGLLYNNYKRREEVRGTIANCNVALGFDELNIYLKDKTLNVHSAYRPWFWWFLVGILATLFGIFLILFVSKQVKRENTPVSINLNLTLNKDTIRLKRIQQL